MNSQHHTTEDRLFDLLAARATEGLSPLEEAELEVLLVRFPEYDDLGLDEAAAALDLVWQHSGPAPESLPQDLLERMANDASRYICKPPPEPLPVPRSQLGPSRPRIRLPWATLGWIVAAACLLIAVWNRWDHAFTPKEGLDRLLASKAVNIKINEKGTNKYPDVQAKFYWSNEQQKGYVKLSGLAQNDPEKRQYQLWILDKKRKGQKVDRVDGGVFDVDADGTVIVPIDPKLKVFEPYGFAITREAPGGTVESDLSDVVVLAVAKKA